MTVILPQTQKIARPLDRKTAVVSLTKTLADSTAFADRYLKGWGYTCEALLKLLEVPPLPTTLDDSIPDVDADELGFGVDFTQLNTCRKLPRDPWPDVTDTKKWVGTYLREADVRHNGKVRFISYPSLVASLECLLTYSKRADWRICARKAFARGASSADHVHESLSLSTDDRQRRFHGDAGEQAKAS